MDGNSIAKNFIFGSKYSSKSDNSIYDIKFDSECREIVDNDNYFIRYIVRLLLVNYFKLLTNNVNVSTKDQIVYNEINSDLVMKKRINNNKPDTILELFEISNKVTGVEDNYINLNLKRSSLEKIINGLNIFTTTRYLKYFLNIKSIKSKLFHILENPDSNNVSKDFIEELADVNSKYNYSLVSNVVLFITYFKFLYTDGDKETKTNAFLKNIPDNYKTFILLTFLILLFTPFIFWIKNSGCNYFKSFPQKKSVFLFLTSYITLLLYIYVYSIVLYYIFVKIIFKKMINYDHNIYDFTKFYDLITIKNMIISIFSIILYNFIDLQAFSYLNKILLKVQKPYFQSIEKNIGHIKTSLYKLTNYTFSKCVSKAASPIKFSFIILCLYLILSNWYYMWLKLFGLGSLKSLSNDMIAAFLFYILFIHIVTWLYINLNRGKKSKYTIFVGFLALGSIYFAISSCYAYSFLANMLNDCKSVKISDTSVKVSKEKYDFQTILIDTILKPSIPVILIVMILYIYPKKKWKYLDKILFFSILVIYYFSKNLLSNTLNTVMLIFIGLLFIFRFSLILHFFK